MKFCETEWEPLLEEFRRRPNVWTFESQLPDRCFESLYIITILERGFAFDRFSRSITYALEVNTVYPFLLLFTHIDCVD